MEQFIIAALSGALVCVTAIAVYLLGTKIHVDAERIIEREKRQRKWPD